MLILNSRITILKEARERKPELVKCFEGKRCNVYLLDMTAMEHIEKAKIFYNHIAFNGMEDVYFAEIRKEKRYLKIIKHPNYTPRIMEFICNKNRLKDIAPAHYYEFVIQQLNNPREIWKDEYERKLQKADRLLLLTLYSLSDSRVEESMVKECFERRISLESDIDTTINQYEASLTRLLDGFIHIVSECGKKNLSMINPSVNDYLDGRLNSSPLEKQQLIDNSFSIQQKKRLLSESEFNSFGLTTIQNHELEKYLFENETQKNAFVSYYVCKNKVFDKNYTSYIYDYLSSPSSLNIYGNTSISAVGIFRWIFRNDVCDFYKIGNYIKNEDILDKMLDYFELEDLINVVGLINCLFDNEYRDVFVETASYYLRNAVEKYCENIDVLDFDVDIDYAIEMSRDEYDIDIDEAVYRIEEDIISNVESEIKEKLSTLPIDISAYQHYTTALSFSIYGVKNLISSYFEDNRYSNYDYIEPSDNNDDSEIEYIFNRK